MAKTALEQWDETAANNLDLGGTSIAEGCNPGNINNAMREEMAQFAKWLGDDTVASATTADLGAVPGRYINITGTTTITGFGTIKAGTIKFVKFAGALTLTHNASSLILPGAANIITAAGDTGIFVSEGSGNWRCLNYQRAAGEQPLIHVREEQAAGTNGGSSVGGAVQTRTLNTVVTNEISGASLASSLVTLPEGTYYVEISATAFQTDRNKVLLWNHTDSAYVMTGQAVGAGSTVAVDLVAFTSGRFTVPSGGRQYSIRHYTETIKTTNGLGRPVSFAGTGEVYSDFKAWKIK